MIKSPKILRTLYDKSQKSCSSKKMSVDKNNKCKNKMHHYLGSSKYVPETGTLSPKG